MYFNLRSFDLRPGLGLPPHLYSVSFSSMCRKTDNWLQLVRRKLSLTRWFSLDKLVQERDRKAQVRPLVQYLRNRIGTIDRTSGQPQVKLSLLRSISLKIRLLLFCGLMCSFRHTAALANSSLLSKIRYRMYVRKNHTFATVSETCIWLKLFIFSLLCCWMQRGNFDLPIQLLNQ